MSEWLPKWETTGWVAANGDPVANRELWQELASVAQDHKTCIGFVAMGTIRISSGAMRWRSARAAGGMM